MGLRTCPHMGRPEKGIERPHLSLLPIPYRISPCIWISCCIQLDWKSASPGTPPISAPLGFGMLRGVRGCWDASCSHDDDAASTLDHGPSLVPVPVEKRWANATWKGKGLLGLELIVRHGGKSGQEPGGRNSNRGCEGMLLTDLLLTACSACFLTPSRTTCLPHQSLIKGKPHRLADRPPVGSHPSLEVLSH